jgi:hypothetical protein
MEITFYDNSGRAVAYSEDGEHVFTFSGHAVAFIKGASIYDYSGRHLGWFKKGWVRENAGRYVYFTEKAKGGPPRPTMERPPSKVTKQTPPAKNPLRFEPKMPEIPAAWSAANADQFFNWYVSH